MAQPDPSGTPELCVNCGMPPCKRPPTLPITLLFSKATKQVLCVEANKDFIDTLFGFLTLPLGGIVKLFQHHALIHHPSCPLAPRPSTPLVFPPDCPYTPAPKKTKNDSSAHFAMSSLSNVFDSVVRLDPKEMSIQKSCLVDPKPGVVFGAGKLVDMQNEPVVASEDEPQKPEVANSYFGCGNPCPFYAMSRGVKCPKHKKKLAVAMKGVENASSGNSQRSRIAFSSSFAEVTCPVLTDLQNSNWAGTVPASASSSPSPSPSPPSYSEFTRRVSRGLSRMQLALPSSPAPSMIEPKVEGYGYVKEGTKYMVTNTLEIYASAQAIKALIALDVVRCERVGDLDTMAVSVVTAEVLQLLKLSFTSTNVLHDVFGKYCADLKTVVFQEKNPPFFPKCVENPCCDCSRMGTPMASPDHTSL